LQNFCYAILNIFAIINYNNNYDLKVLEKGHNLIEELSVNLKHWQIKARVVNLNQMNHFKKVKGKFLKFSL
jgi:hypothetical protein